MKIEIDIDEAETREVAIAAVQRHVKQTVEFAIAEFIRSQEGKRLVASAVAEFMASDLAKTVLACACAKELERSANSIVARRIQIATRAASEPLLEAARVKARCFDGLCGTCDECRGRVTE